MAYQGAAAYALAYEQTQTVAPVREPAPSFEVIEGGGLDARARRGVSASFVAGARLAIMAVLAVLAVGCIRIALSTATVTQLEEVRQLRNQVSDLEDLNSRLEVERSIDASSQRIVAIATQAYGMVYASDVDTLRLSYADEAVEGEPEAALAEEPVDADAEEGEDSLEDGTPVMASAEATGEDGR